MQHNEARIRELDFWTSKVELEHLKGGLSNISFVATSAGKRYVVRLGEDYPFHHVFRDHEIMVSRAAYDAGFSPRLVYQTQGVMIFDFIAGKTLQGSDVVADLKQVSGLLRGFHKKMPLYVSGGARLFWVFYVIRDYARTLLNIDVPQARDLNRYLQICGELESVQLPLPLVFSHNDMLPANLIRDENKTWLIDFEYAAFSTPLFDLAGLAANAGFSSEQDRELLACYFDREADTDLIKSLAAMKAAALLREAMWSMVSGVYLDTPGIDYQAYADENLQKFESELENYYTEYGRSKT